MSNYFVRNLCFKYKCPAFELRPEKRNIYSNWIQFQYQSYSFLINSLLETAHCTLREVSFEITDFFECTEYQILYYCLLFPISSKQCQKSYVCANT